MSKIKISPRKRFGQHFLKDLTVIEKIIAAIAPQKADHLIEIGPGLGALTRYLLPLLNQLQVIELDRDLIPILQKLDPSQKKLIIHPADVLKVDFAQLSLDNKPLRTVGNLPYNISTPLIFHLLKQIHLIHDMFFMLQKEVAERMAAAAGSEHYGRLSVMVQYQTKVEILFLVPPEAFHPPPQVDSAIVQLMPRSPEIKAENYQTFALLVREAFNHRRKMLRKAWQSLVNVEQLTSLEIDPCLRPEQLTVNDFVRVANLVGV